jgi:hypothetical protein
MTSKRQACRWSSGVGHLGVAVLGVAVLGTAVGLNAKTKSPQTHSVSTCAKPLIDHRTSASANA